MRALVSGLALLILAGCSATKGSTSDGTGGGGGAGGGATASASSGSSGGLGGGPSLGASSGSGGGGSGAPLAEVFAHSSETLFRLDPDTKVVTVVGAFSGCSMVTDIAVDKNGVMFGTTFDGLYRIDKKTALCAHAADGSYPNSLSFVPQGTLDPNQEALVGYVGSTYVRIDTKTGALSNVGDLGSADGYVSSGDVVSVIGGSTYLTVNGGNCSDCIVEVDPKTGALVKMIGALPFTNVYGLAYWGGVAYGFDDTGALFEIDLPSASTKLIPVSSAPAGLAYWGAGSTTAAPMIPK